jgi:hypothetical protein
MNTRNSILNTKIQANAAQILDDRLLDIRYISLWRWYINIIIPILDIIHCPVFYLKKQDFSGSGFCLLSIMY